MAQKVRELPEEDLGDLSRGGLHGAGEGRTKPEGNFWMREKGNGPSLDIWEPYRVLDAHTPEDLAGTAGCA